MKKLSKKLLSFLLIAVMTLGITTTAFASNNSDKTYIALGADLNESQQAIVLNYLGISNDNLVNCNIVTITNAQEHQYLDSYIPSNEIGTNALSSVRIDQTSSGSGINVTTYNINYCTSGMYSNALATAGITNANVIVAAPSEISGTAALIGAIEAYSIMTNTEIDPDIIDGAIDEIVTTGELEETTGYTDEIEGIIAYLKSEIDDIDEMTDEETDAEIRKVANDFGFWLDDDEVIQIRELLKKLKTLNLDWDAISSQAQNLFNNLESNGFDLGGLDISNFGLNMDNSTFISKVQNTFNKIIDFFKGTFKRNNS